MQTKDIALAPITITAERELDIDFSKPFMDFSMSLIMQKPGEPKIDIFAFLSPFTSGVWLSTIAVVKSVQLIFLFLFRYIKIFRFISSVFVCKVHPCFLVFVSIICYRNSNDLALIDLVLDS